jgi:UDP-2,3-diacylglucosamine pyrophosphatase LpxH
MTGKNSQIHDTLILSDLHLGSEMSRASDALNLLERTEYRQLILLGDIFSDLNFRRLTGEHWQFLSRLRKLSNPKRKVKVVWVEGNHDHGLSNIMSHLVGVPVYQRYVWEYAGRRHLAVHGHQFDRFVSRNLLISRIGEQIYYQLQKIDSHNKFVTRHLDRFNTRWLRLTEKVASGAIAYARAGKADRVFCGHTHAAIERHEQGISYYNSGSWVDATATYITIGEEGVRINAYQPRTHHRDSSEERGEQPAAPSDLFEQAGLPAFAGYESVRC